MALATVSDFEIRTVDIRSPLACRPSCPLPPIADMQRAAKKKTFVYGNRNVAPVSASTTRKDGIHRLMLITISLAMVQNSAGLYPRPRPPMKDL